jgi:hypothetical protein
MTAKIFEKVKQALIKKYEAQADAARANIEVYQNNMVGVGEHAIMTETIEEEYKKLDSACSMLDTLNNN